MGVLQVTEFADLIVHAAIFVCWRVCACLQLNLGMQAYFLAGQDYLVATFILGTWADAIYFYMAKLVMQIIN